MVWDDNWVSCREEFTPPSLVKILKFMIYTAIENTIKCPLINFFNINL